MSIRNNIWLDPDELLALTKLEETRGTRDMLKILL